MKNRTVFILASVLGFSAIAMGAFGAHALKPMLIETCKYDVWTTAVHYHSIHAIALLIIGVWQAQRREQSGFSAIALFWVLGVLLFSGSLYLLAMGAPSFFGPITPVGGVLMMLGWISVGVVALRDDGDKQHPHI